MCIRDSYWVQPPKEIEDTPTPAETYASLAAVTLAADPPPLSEEESICLLYTSSLAPSQCENRDGSGQAVSSVADHTPLAWEFYADAFPWANARLARYADEPPDVLIVDEVGRLELTRGGGLSLIHI